MNLDAIVAPYTRAITPSITCTLKVSTGSVTGADFSRTPTYQTFPGVTVDVQALTSKMIEHMDALNIAGTLRAFWFNGFIQGLNRPAGKGGDIVIFPDGREWLVVQDAETWDSAGWCHVIGQLQNGNVAGS